jgi:hypothetical protein
MTITWKKFQNLLAVNPNPVLFGFSIIHGGHMAAYPIFSSTEEIDTLYPDSVILSLDSFPKDLENCVVDTTDEKNFSILNGGIAYVDDSLLDYSNSVDLKDISPAIFLNKSLRVAEFSYYDGQTLRTNMVFLKFLLKQKIVWLLFSIGPNDEMEIG